MRRSKLFLYIFVASAVILSPLGLITENEAWGEWSSEEFQKMIGYVPEGIKNGTVVASPLADYTFAPFGAVGGYLFSAVIGCVVIISLFYVIQKAIHAKR